MTPYTLDDAEHALRTALDGGDYQQITTAAAAVDRLDTPNPLPSLAASALWYAEQGLKVFPLQPGTKIPYKGSSGCLDASTNPDVVRGWWTDSPDANIGLATGDLVDVFDFDGLTGQTSRAHNWELFEQLNVLGVVSTPRAGGMHLYVPAAGRGNKAGLLPGVDYRGRGGYVVAPPSRRADGGIYQWTRPLDLEAALMGAAA